MADHKPATTRTSILVGKLVIANRHVHCARLDNKRRNTHSELGEHGNERAIDLTGRHRNVRPWLQVGRCLDDLIQVDIGGKR